MPMPKSPHVYFEYCRRYSIWLVLLRARCSCTRVSPARWRQGKINTQGLTGAHKTAKAPEYRRSCTSDNHPDPRRMAGRAGRAPFVSPKRLRILSAAVATKRRKVPYTSRASLVSSFWTEYPTTTTSGRGKPSVTPTLTATTKSTVSATSRQAPWAGLGLSSPHEDTHTP